MFTALKLRQKNNPTRQALPARRLREVLGWTPLVGLILLVGFAAMLAIQLVDRGKTEGNIAWTSGRYVHAYLTSGEIKGKLLQQLDNKDSAPKESESKPVSSKTTSASESASINIPVVKSSDGVRLKDAPNMALVEKSDTGLLPIISPDGDKPWQYYSRPFTKKGNMSLVSVIVTGLGMQREMSLKASSLPPEICLSVSPYSAEVSVWMQSMRAKGHEFLLDLPLQTTNFPLSDPGPDALMANITPAENMKRLKTIIGRTTGYVGLVAPAEEVFFDAEKDFTEPVVRELASRGLLTIFAGSKDRIEFAKIMKNESLAHLDADINIRYGADMNDILQQLASAEVIAHKRGTALVVVRASPIALEQLEKWSAGLSAKGLQLAPVSVLARGPFS
jgi:polysaccharide deacetylase 2 family uncharacterized protein YibQ